MDIEYLKSIADLSQIVKHLSGTEGKSIGTYKLRYNPCPLCGHNDCFTVFTDSQTFKCFSAECNESGDVISFVQIHQKIDFPSAVKYLCEYYNLDPSEYKDIQNSKPEDKSVQDIRRIAAEYYHAALFTEPAKPVLQYLTEKRGYSIDTLKHFQIGFATGDLRQYLESQKFSFEQIKKSGLIIYHEKTDQTGYFSDQFPFGGIVFPHTYHGKYLNFSYKYNINKKGAFIYKVPDEKGHKRVSLQLKLQYRDPAWLGYNQDVFDYPPEIDGWKTQIILTEGEWEVLSFYEKAKYPYIFGIFGETGNKLEQAAALPKDYSYILAFDHDPAGERYTNQFGLSLFQKEIQVQILPYGKDYKDPDEWLSSSLSPTTEFGIVSKNLERYIPIGEDGKPDPETRIFRRGNTYWIIEFDNKTKAEREVKITNFVIDFPVQYISENEDGEINIEREFILKNELGEVSKPCRITPDQLVVLKKFQAFLYSQGFFELCQNTDPVLSNLRQYLHKRQARKNVFIRNQIGYLEDEKLFLLGNGIVEPGGRLINSDQNNIIWQYDSKGFKSAAIDSNMNLPFIEKRAVGKDYHNLIDEIIMILQSNYGSDAIPLAIGWFRASLFADLIFNEFHEFPILWVYGVTKSGKNTLLELLYNLIGFEAPNPRTMESVKLTWLYRQLAFFSNLPVWIDEHNFKNEASRRACESFYGPIRGIYNRIGKGMAVDASMKTRSFPVNGTLIISGESLPSDVAVRNRCILIAINKKNRNDELYRNVLRLKPRFKEVFYNWICERLDPNFCKNKIQRIHQIISFLKTKNITGREAENYAITAAFTEDLFIVKSMQKDFITDFLPEEAKTKFHRIEEENIINLFNSDLELMIVNKEYINTSFFKINSDNTKLYIYGQGVHGNWLSYRKRELYNSQFHISYSEFLDIVQEQDYFIEYGKLVNFPNPVGKKRAIVFDIAKIPESYNQVLLNLGFVVPDENDSEPPPF